MKFIFSQHALQQIFKRAISIAIVKRAVLEGETIKVYEDDRPYPSKLNLLSEGDLYLHVVFAEDSVNNSYIVITAYYPDPVLWDAGFKIKK